MLSTSVDFASRGVESYRRPACDGAKVLEEGRFQNIIQEALHEDDFTLEVGARWTQVWFSDAPPLPQQGWKLHVSAYPGNAAEVLSRSLAVFRLHRACFKVAVSPSALEVLNAGAGGATQIGKFITVYPVSDEQAVIIAQALHTATVGMAGPRVPSDQPLHPSSLVHYRFGALTYGTLIQLADGTVAAALVSPSGVMEPDERRVYFQPPAWVENPFPDHGSEAVVTRTLAVHPRYRVLNLVTDTGRGSVWLGVDLDAKRRCIFKTESRGRMDGRPSTGLRREANLLKGLPPEAGGPAVYDLLETPDQLILVMEDIDGVPLDEHLAIRSATGTPLRGRDLHGLVEQLLSAVEMLHERGIVHRDLKASNILVMEDGRIRLVDFEHARPVGEVGNSGGTRGYVSPQQRAGQAADPTDDVYALGALLILLSTGAEPSHAPNAQDLLARPMTLLNPDVAQGFASAVEGCLAPDARERMSGIAAVRAALTRPDAARRGRARSTRDTPDPTGRAWRMLDALCERSIDAGDGARTWVSTAPRTLPIPYRQINNGVPGLIVSLAIGCRAFGSSRHAETLARSARWLARSAELPGAKVSGLYAGEAGVGAALLYAGGALGDNELLAAAYDCAKRLRAHPFGCEDLFSGTAGRLRFLVMLYLVANDKEVLSDALDCADHIHRSAIVSREGEAHWKIASANDEVLEVASYAHGASGIADALLDLYEVTGDNLHRKLAVEAARWVCDQSIVTLPSRSGLDWGNGGAFSGLWCYGASGVGILFIHLAQLGLLRDATRIATAAGMTAATASRSAPPGLCHGLDGPLHYILDLHQLTRDPEWLRQASDLAKLLDAFHVDDPRGYPAIVEAESDISFMGGDAGVATTLIRLADRGRTPPPLGLASIRDVLHRDRGQRPDVSGATHAHRRKSAFSLIY